MRCITLNFHNKLVVVFLQFGDCVHDAAFVVGLTRSRKSANHRAEFLLAAPQLLIALAGRLQPFCRLARLLFVHLSPLTEAPARSAKSVPETVTLRFAMQSQLCTLHSIAR